MRAEGVPEHHVGVLERRVVAHVGRQPGAAGVLVRVLAGGVALARIVARDPEVPGHEAGALRDGGLRPRERQHVLARHQLVGDRLAETVPHRGVHDLPEAPGERVEDPLGLALRGQQRRLGVEGVVVRVLGPGRVGDGVDLVDRVVEPVHHHVEPGVEEVLVNGPVDPGRDHLAPPRLLPGPLGAVRDDAGQLDLELDRAVLVEVPVEAVLVVADRRDGRHDQAA